MSDSNNNSATSRRDFLRGGFLRRALQETEEAQAPVRPKPPVHTPAPPPQQTTQSPNQPGEALTPEQTLELARARARAMIGVVKPPTDQQPFDILSLLTSFDRRPDQHSDHQPSADDQPLVAHINPARCLAHNGSFCTVCSEHCPAEGAIEINNHLPHIIPAACTGCAECYRVCPAPVIAIALTPIEQSTPNT